MSREENLAWLNELLEEEHGMALVEGDKLIDSEIDSFGITMVLLTMDQKFGEKFNDKWLKSIVIEELTVTQILDRME